MLFRHRLAVFLLLLALGMDWVGAQAVPTDWPTKPLSLSDALEIALRQNNAILKGKQDIEESQGLALQLKGVYTPKIRSTGRYTAVELAKIEVASFGAPGQATNGFRFQGDQNWNADVQITQPIYAGGRLKSAQRQSKLTLEAIVANYHAVVADALLQVRVTFQDLLLAAETIQVNEASIQLLEKELADTRRRFEAGVVPRFNVLRAEVELANAKPRLFRARNAQRTARNTLAMVLGYTVPKEAGLDVPLEISGSLIQETHDLSLSDALLRAMSQRTELKALRTGEKIRDEEVIQAKAGLYPNLGLFGGYGWQNKNFPHALNRSVDGWLTGAQLQWDVWDFGTTRGKVQSAKARKERSQLETQDAYRQIELQVRTAHSNFLEARDVLESQARVIEQAEEALRLATARAEAGTGTQLDVLGAQTALTQARNTYAQALRDHTVAWDRLQRAVGGGVKISK